MAFINAFSPTAAGSFISKPVSVSARASQSVSVATVRMAEKSPSVPFMDVPANLDPSMPGYAGFDPFNISAFLNVKWLQESEIKHGRICMLAIVGAIVAELYTFPWYSNAPALWIDRHNWGVHNGSLLQVLVWTSFFEIMTLPALIQMVKGESDRQPGYFGFDPLGIMAKDPLAAQKEVKNGRLAMVAISGAIHHAAITNQNLVEQLLNGNIMPSI